jgi:hypothetical protein
MQCSNSARQVSQPVAVLLLLLLLQLLGQHEGLGQAGGVMGLMQQQKEVLRELLLQHPLGCWPWCT